MWRWLVILSAIICVGLFPVTALAATTQDVTITATPGYGIISFNIDYISETQMDLSWATDAAVNKVMVRAKYGSDLAEIPNEDTAPSDGYLVYYDTGNSVSDTSLDFDQNPGPLYYKIWGQKEDGKWFTGSMSAWEESAIVTLLGLIGLALVLFVFMFVKKRAILAWSAIAAWLVLGAYCYTKYSTEWDTYYSIFFLAIAFMFITAIELWRIVSSSSGVEPEGEMDEEDQALLDDFEGMRKERENYRSIFVGKKRRPKRRVSRYEQTGEF